MRFIGLDNRVLKDTIKNSAGDYRYSLGDMVEITTIKMSNHNTLMSGNLASSIKEDKFMMKYLPSNTIYFTEKLVSGGSMDNISCYLDKETNSVYIGTYDEYEMKSGVLMFSGILGLNKYVESERYIYVNSKMTNNIKKYVMVLSVGALGDKLFGLYYIPNRRGIAVRYGTSLTTGVSVSSFKKVHCADYKKFTISDWFSGTKIRVCEGDDK